MMNSHGTVILKKRLNKLSYISKFRCCRVAHTTYFGVKTSSRCTVLVNISNVGGLMMPDEEMKTDCHIKGTPQHGWGLASARPQSETGYLFYSRIIEKNYISKYTIESCISLR